MKFRKHKLHRLFALMLVVSAFFMVGTTAFASDAPAQDSLAVEMLTVNEVWLTGDTLHISVTDKTSGGSQTLELNLRDYAKSGDEYVTVQATDASGRTSNAIQFKNPYYTPSEETTKNDGAKEEQSESAVPNSIKPFTPDGTGTIVDNATDGDGKEFFTVETPDGNAFYLIVDRQRDSENVYLLNAVNEDDLASLAKSGDGKGVSAIPTTTPPATSTPPETTPTPEPTPDTQPQKSSSNAGMLGIMAVVLIVVGGTGYYFKIVRPKQSGYDYETEEYTEVGDEYVEPGEEEPLRYATDDEERSAEEGEVHDR